MEKRPIQIPRDRYAMPFMSLHQVRILTGDVLARPIRMDHDLSALVRQSLTVLIGGGGGGAGGGAPGFCGAPGGPGSGVVGTVGGGRTVQATGP